MVIRISTPARGSPDGRTGPGRPVGEQRGHATQPALGLVRTPGGERRPRPGHHERHQERSLAKGTILGVSIDESLLQPSEKTMVEDLIAAALNDARAKADQAANSEMQKVTSGLPLPPGMKLPF